MILKLWLSCNAVTNHKIVKCWPSCDTPQLHNSGQESTPPLHLPNKRIHREFFAAGEGSREREGREIEGAAQRGGASRKSSSEAKRSLPAPQHICQPSLCQPEEGQRHI